MAELNDTLGQRIIEATRIAAAMHLDQVAEAGGQQVAIGRADFSRATDGGLFARGDVAALFGRTPFSAEGAAG
jgi:hypothetical protein